MTRALPFGRKELRNRRITLADQKKILRIARRWKVEEAQTRVFYRTLYVAYGSFRAALMASKQEHPSRVVAALKPVGKGAERLLQALVKLPDWVRADVDPGGIEQALRCLLEQVSRSETRWAKYVVANKAPGAQTYQQWLAQDVAMAFQTFSPLSQPGSRSKSLREREITREVALCLNLFGVKHANEAKDRKKFFGVSKLKSAPETRVPQNRK